jgi:hypothetical protein
MLFLPSVLGSRVGVVPNAMLHATESYTQLLDDTSAAGKSGVLVIPVSRGDRDRRDAKFDGCRMICSRVPPKGVAPEARCCKGIDQ